MRFWLLLTFASIVFSSCQQSSDQETTPSSPETDTVSQAVDEPIQMIYGFRADSFLTYESQIGRNDFLSTILNRFGVNPNVVYNITQAAMEVFDVRKIQAGKPYCVLCSPDSIARYFIYAPNDIDYVVYDFSRDDSVCVYQQAKPITYHERKVTGVIQSSLYQSMQRNGIDPLLAIKLSEIYAWSIDFYRIQKGDRYKVVYQEKWVDDKPVGIGKIDYALFTHEGDPFYAFYFEQDSVGDYFDEKAQSLRKAFLKAPVKFSNITSHYTMKRFHPVLKVNKPHLGTDYAADYGTPIMTTGDGEVIAAAYTSGNGNYVKVRHNGTYTTQYLHMSRFAKGIKKGVRVRQGDVIGYVGSTGLATGPHVCYRFWKNGKQVDPLKEKIPPSEPVKEQYMSRYELQKKAWMKQLDAIPYPDDPSPTGVTVSQH